MNSCQLRAQSEQAKLNCGFRPEETMSQFPARDRCQNACSLELGDCLAASDRNFCSVSWSRCAASCNRDPVATVSYLKFGP